MNLNLSLVGATRPKNHIRIYVKYRTHSYPVLPGKFITIVTKSVKNLKPSTETAQSKYRQHTFNICIKIYGDVIQMIRILRTT